MEIFFSRTSLIVREIPEVAVLTLSLELSFLTFLSMSFNIFVVKKRGAFFEFCVFREISPFDVFGISFAFLPAERSSDLFEHWRIKHESRHRIHST